MELKPELRGEDKGVDENVDAAGGDNGAKGASGEEPGGIAEEYVGVTSGSPRGEATVGACV